MKTKESRTKKSIWAGKLGELLGIDPRSLALMRICAGTLLLVDLAIRSRDLRALYSDEGIFPIAASRSFHGGAWTWSLHHLNGSVEYQTLLFAIAAVFAIALLAGYRTRLATIVSWVVLASLHNRIPLVYNGGDLLLRMLLFWGMFLPLGRRWSIDAWRQASDYEHGSCAEGRLAIEGPTPIVSVASASILLQVCFMYVFTGLLKFNEDWLGGDGLYYSLSLLGFTKPAGTFLLQFPGLLKWLALATLGLELFGPVAVWFPWRNAHLRLAMIGLFLGLHLAIELCLNVGLFSWVSIAAWTLFLPRAFWESRLISGMAGRLAAKRRKLSAKNRMIQAAGQGRAMGNVVSAWAGGAVCAFFLGYVFAWNIGTLDDSAGRMPSWMRSIGELTMIGQKWNMFANPPQSGGWYVARARLVDGSIVDVLRDGAAVGIGRPEPIFPVSFNQHWRYFFLNLTEPASARFHRPAAEFLCRTWNERHAPQQQIIAMDLLYFEERHARDQGEREGFVSRSLARINLGSSGETGAFAEALQTIKRGEALWP